MVSAETDFDVVSLADLQLDDASVALQLSELQSIVSEKPVTIELKWVQEILDTPTCDILVMVADGRLVGMAQATYVPKLNGASVWVDNVGLLEEWQGGGRGTFLMDALIKRIITLWPHAKKISLTSSPRRNTETFYRRLGFVPRTGDNPTVVYEFRRD